jgi:hypothetical protein
VAEPPEVELEELPLTRTWPPGTSTVLSYAPLWGVSTDCPLTVTDVELELVAEPPDMFELELLSFDDRAGLLSLIWPDCWSDDDELPLESLPGCPSCPDTRAAIMKTPATASASATIINLTFLFAVFLKPRRRSTMGLMIPEPSLLIMAALTVIACPSPLSAYYITS